MARNGFRIFDSDLHVCEPPDLWQRYTEPRYRDRAPVGTRTWSHFSDMNITHEGRFVDPQGSLSYGDMDRILDSARRHGRLEIFEDYEARGWGPDVQLEAMDREGIDVAALYPSRGLTANAKLYDDDGLAAAVARAYNDWLADFCAAAPDRLLGAGMVHPQDVAAAAAEVRRMATELGFKAIYIRPNPLRGRNWHDLVYDPLWAECERQGLLVGFHEGSPSTLPTAVAERFDGGNEHLWTTAHVARHPVEMMYAMLCMIMGGVMERFPGLRVAFLEANCSWLPYWLWRMDEHHEAVESEVRARVPRRPSDYFRERGFACIEAEETTAGPAVEDFADNIVFSTDFPHGDSAFPNAVTTFLSLPLSDGQKRRILWDNSARMYGLA